VNVVARVNTPDGPLKEAAVEIVSGVKSEVVTIGTGKVVDGLLDVSAEPGPVWGLRVDGQPIVGFPVSFDGSRIDFGDIDIVREGVLWPAFHAVDGRVYGVPRAIQSKPAATSALMTSGDRNWRTLHPNADFPSLRACLTRLICTGEVNHSANQPVRSRLRLYLMARPAVGCSARQSSPSQFAIVAATWLVVNAA